MTILHATCKWCRQKIGLYTVTYGNKYWYHTARQPNPRKCLDGKHTAEPEYI